ncbi:unnamed protein product [Lactuca saligna]|uniref:GRF-type domain-containing protein n=1 Tax=Lactuca saligna TaxID=75948 RepID=A0AA35ZGS9_LACSI|nr:unnamed protein product [Lactuca saligna]
MKNMTDSDGMKKKTRFTLDAPSISYIAPPPELQKGLLLRLSKGFFFFVSHLLLLLRDSQMVLCFCGNVAVVRTSWTSRNPGRRFYACPKMGSKCGFVGWFDPPMCQRLIVIIPGLLRTMNRYEVEVGQLKKCLLVSWVLFLLFVLF